MSKERYYELYKQFLNHTISENDYQDLMKWVADENNDRQLRHYMTILWEENNWSADAKPRNWQEFKSGFGRDRKKSRNPKVISMWFGRRRNTNILTYAASAAVLLLITFAVFQFNQSEEIIYQTAYGQTQDIELSDGSLVTLNANSSLRWQEDWRTTGERYITLDGEAFFDVAHTTDQIPFTVETKDLKVKVLGTTFNVSSRRKHTDVTLESGRIELDLNRVEHSALKMEPGDRINFSSVDNVLHRDKVETIAESANWLDGVLRFEDVTVEEMFKEIEDQYGKTLITRDSSLLTRRMFTGIPYKDWPVVKESLELALDVNIEEQGDQLFVKNDN